MRINRRRFLRASAAGVGVVSVAGVAAAGASGRVEHTASEAPSVNDAVLKAFKSHRLVGLGEAHGLQEHHDVLQRLLTDPRIADVVDDVVVEFGNALYQDTLDRFISGHPIDNVDLRPVWQNTTESPINTWDQPVYEQLFRTVRAMNWTRHSGKQIRVLAGDPPIDWSQVRTASDWHTFLVRRDSHAASVIEREVLAKGRRGLLCYASGHLYGSSAGQAQPNLVSLVKKHTGERTYTIAVLLPLAGDPGGLAKKLAGYRRDVAIPTAGTWLGSFDAGLLAQLQGASRNKNTNAFCGVPAKDLFEGGLYLGQPKDLTASWWNPAIYLDQAYWTELQRRNAIEGNTTDLTSYRQNQPARWQLTKLPASEECGKG